MSVLGELAALELGKATSALRQLWSELKGGARVPLRGAFGPEVLKPWLSNIVIVEARGTPPRFLIRLAGTAAVSFAGRDFTGRFLDEVIPPDHYETTVEPYLYAIETAQPAEDDILRHQFFAPDGTNLPVRRLVMPCSSDGALIDRFVVGLFLYRPESR